MGSKIEIKNNWEYLTYFFNGKQIPEKKPGTALLTNGDLVEYIPVKEISSYSDCGGHTSVTRYVLKATINYGGQELTVDLTELDLQEITPTEWKQKYLEVMSEQYIQTKYNVPIEFELKENVEIKNYIKKNNVKPVSTNKTEEYFTHRHVVLKMED